MPPKCPFPLHHFAPMHHVFIMHHPIHHPHPYTIPPCGSNAPRSSCTTCPLDPNCYTSLHHARYLPACLKIEVTRLNVNLSPTVDHDRWSSINVDMLFVLIVGDDEQPYSAQCGLSASLWSENKKLFFTETKTCSIIPTHTPTWIVSYFD